MYDSQSCLTFPQGNIFSAYQLKRKIMKEQTKEDRHDTNIYGSQSMLILDWLLNKGSGFDLGHIAL